MNQNTLIKANDLAKKIKEHQYALNCFEWDENTLLREIDGEDIKPKIVSTNPQLIIEQDDIEEHEGRVQQRVPMVLSDFLINIIKEQIKENLKVLNEEFEKL